MNEGRAASYAGIAEASCNLANGHDGHDREGCGEGDFGGDNDGVKIYIKERAEDNSQT